MTHLEHAKETRYQALSQASLTSGFALPEILLARSPYTHVQMFSYLRSINAMLDDWVSTLA